MVGIASLANANAPEGKKISLFYNQTNKNLALEQRNEHNKSDSPVTVYVSPDVSQSGIIENPSQVAATDLDGLTIVFGFTAPKPDPDGKPLPNHDVSIISPVYRPVGTTLKSNKTIAAASYGSSASVFYLVGGGGNSVHIEEEVVGENSPTEWKGATGILEGSSLAAYWAEEDDGPVRRIIYQAEDDGDLYDYEPEDGPKKIKHAEARDGSPLAVTVANKKAYLYYVTARNELEKIVKSDISNPKSWGSNDTIKTSKKVHAESQITVVPAGGQNHIFFASGADGKVFEHVIDAW